jgi:hypothetical protein
MAQLEVVVFQTSEGSVYLFLVVLNETDVLER